jgi:hypothetical protein
MLLHENLAGSFAPKRETLPKRPPFPDVARKGVEGGLKWTTHHDRLAYHG